MPAATSKCPFCLCPVTDPPRHLDTHSDTRELRLFVLSEFFLLPMLRKLSDRPLVFSG